MVSEAVDLRCAAGEVLGQQTEDEHQTPLHELYAPSYPAHRTG